MVLTIVRVVALVTAGSLGALARHGIHTATRPFARPWLPVGTLLINVGGAFAIGLVVGWPGGAHATLRSVTATGFLGGFTTFSTFSLETWTLQARGHLLGAWAYALGNVAAGLAAAWLGTAIAVALAGALGHA